MNSPYIIAELGQSHGGCPGQALMLAEACAQAGANAVKFQDHRWGVPKAEHPPSEDYLLELPRKLVARPEYLERRMFQTDVWDVLAHEVKALGADFIVSPFSATAAEEQADRVTAWKVASGQVTNEPMLRVMAETSKRVFWSNGMDLAEPPEWLTAKCDVVRMACTSSYPMHPRVWLNWDAGVAGFSDHSHFRYGANAALLYLARGVRYFERHVHPGLHTFHNDREVSLTPQELVRYVGALQMAAEALESEHDEAVRAEEVAPARGYFT